MKRYIKAFLPNFRPVRGCDASFDLESFSGEEFDCGLSHDDMGVYVISATDGTKYKYPNGKESPIIYIGKSDDLLRRLKDEHFGKGLRHLLNDPDYGLKNNEQLASRYQYMFYNGSRVDVFKCRGKQESKEMEVSFLYNFYREYRALPVGNGARSFGFMSNI